MMWQRHILMSNGGVTNNTYECDKCLGTIVDMQAALCFNSLDKDLYLCEPCIELIRKEFIEAEKVNG
jgi:hypothetical protein